MRDNGTEMYRFETAEFVVTAAVHHDDDVDISFDDTNETRDNLNSGLWQAFGVVVTVATQDGLKLGEDSLWGCIYEKPSEFFTSHRDRDPMNRNCTIMRAAKGDNVSICHYFPGMVREAIMHARNRIASMPKLKD